MTESTFVCVRPPEGWYCTRPPGHEGPCAALPVFPLGTGTPPEGASAITEPEARILAGINMARRIEEQAEPRTHSEQLRVAGEAQGEHAVAAYIRKLLEQELPWPPPPPLDERDGMEVEDEGGFKLTPEIVRGTAVVLSVIAIVISVLGLVLGSL